MRFYVVQPDGNVNIIIRTEENETEAEILESVGGGTLISEERARELYRDSIRVSIQNGVQTIPDPGQRSVLLGIVNSLPTEVRELVGENFIQSQLDVINTGLPSV